MQWWKAAPLSTATAVLGMAIFLVGSPVWAQKPQKTVPTATSNSVMGIPVPATKTAVPAMPTGTSTSVDNFYGDNPAGSFENTAQSPGPLQNSVDYGAAPNVSVKNPNNVVAATEGAAANGTGQPLVNEVNSVPTAAVETGLVENPQESPSALVWIIIASVFLIGSIFGLIHWTQPGGQA